jgi:hypothetical protein
MIYIYIYIYIYVQTCTQKRDFIPIYKFELNMYASISKHLVKHKDE